MDEPGAVTSVTFCKQCGEIIIQPGVDLCDDCLSETCCLESQGEPEETAEIEQQWTKPEHSIEQLWKIVEGDLEMIHRLTISQAITQAEKDYSERLARTIGGTKGC